MQQLFERDLFRPTGSHMYRTGPLPKAELLEQIGGVFLPKFTAYGFSPYTHSFHVHSKYSKIAPPVTYTSRPKAFDHEALDTTVGAKKKKRIHYNLNAHLRAITKLASPTEELYNSKRTFAIIHFPITLLGISEVFCYFPLSITKPNVIDCGNKKALIAFIQAREKGGVSTLRVTFFVTRILLGRYLGSPSPGSSLGSDLPNT